MKKPGSKTIHDTKYKSRHKSRHKTRKMHITAQIGGINELMSEEFVTHMYDNMWQFMNKDTITFVLERAGCPKRFTRKADINNNSFSKRYNNTICHKGTCDEGHYVFIDERGKVWGTYEMDILYENDDGICHGFAMAKALSTCGIVMGPIYPHPSNRFENYITIFETYKYIIENGWWDEALSEYFSKDVDWIDSTHSKQTRTALKGINIFLEYLQKNKYRPMDI